MSGELEHVDGTGRVREALEKAVDKGLAIQQPVVARHIAKMRRTRSDAAPSEIVTALERYYLAGVTSSGAAVGGTAAVPGVGTKVAVALSVSEVGGFLEASVLLALAVGEIHGVSVDDLERRRTLVLAVLVGDSGVAVVERAAVRTGRHWGKAIVNGIPLHTIRRVNRILGHNFVTKFGTREGIVVLGRVAPFGIGVIIGAGGNALIGRSVITATRRVFGPPPDEFPSLTDGSVQYSSMPPTSPSPSESP